MSRRPSVELAHSSEEDTTASSLSPPRPFFLAGSSDHGHGADQSDSDSSNNAPIVPPRKQRNHHRRRSALGASQFSADSEDGHVSSRPPPSAFAFPFQAYPGNPDPIPGRVSRRSSVDSVCMVSRSAASNTGPRFPRRPQQDTLARPKSPFKDSPYRSSAASVSSSAIYRSSAAAAAAETTGAQIPRTSSATTIFRSPFLSPASRPLSLWSPPNVQVGLPSRTGSASLLPLPPIPVQKKTMPSTRLKEKLTPQDKPWLAQKKSSLERASKWVTFAGILIGLLIAAYIAFRGYTDVRMLTPNQLCVVLDEQFGDGSLDQDTWSIDVELGGYGNGEFEMTTNSPNNVYISNGQLYIMPTLTSDSISGGYSAVMDGATYKLDGCTASGGTTDKGAWVEPTLADLILQKRQDTGGGGTGNGGGGNGNGGGGTGNGGGGNGGGNGGGGNGGGNGTANGGGTGNGGNGTTTGGNSTNTGNSTSSGNSTSTGNTTSSGPIANPCTAVSSSIAGSVINPVMSGRINTRGKKSIKYGKVEVKAKLPQGDWLWPAIWMLPESNATANGTQSEGTGVYGPWPVSGEIDILEARGNSPSYSAQGSNYVSSSLNYGPFASGSTPIATTSGSSTANLMNSIYGWISSKRTSYASSFHVYAMEWTDSWMRFYVDNRLQAMIDLDAISSKSADSYFWNVAKFPSVAMNMTSGKYIVVQDPWSSVYGGSAAAPFDQQFYLVIDLAAGGTSGWFPDNVGSKPWLDGSAHAMRDFASAQDTWSATWPSNADDRAFRIDYIKMWQLC